MDDPTQGIDMKKSTQYTSCCVTRENIENPNHATRDVVDTANHVTGKDVDSPNYATREDLDTRNNGTKGDVDTPNHGTRKDIDTLNHGTKGDTDASNHVPREDIGDLLRTDTVVVSDFQQELLERNAMKNWDLFYKRNTTAFYKDRHWTTREFPELKNGSMVLLEAGCGVGNFLFPLLEENPGLFIYAFDFSKRAVEFVKKNCAYSENCCKAFQCDVTAEDLSDHMPLEGVDMCSLIFVLSAIHPKKMVQALKNIHKVLKPGGTVLFRDYGLYDHAMLRFKPGHKLAENLYVRQDNTRSYYFSLEKLEEIFSLAGFTVLTHSYVQRRTVNVKEEIDVPRIFVQGRYRKGQTDDRH